MKHNPSVSRQHDVRMEIKKMRQQIYHLSRQIEEMKKRSIDLPRINLSPDRMAEWVDFLNSPKVKELMSTFHSMNDMKSKRKKRKRR